jgi:hypothetical protein
MDPNPGITPTISPIIVPARIKKKVKGLKRAIKLEKKSASKTAPPLLSHQKNVETPKYTYTQRQKDIQKNSEDNGKKYCRRC